MTKENNSPSGRIDGKSTLLRMGELLAKDKASTPSLYPSMALPALHHEGVQKSLVASVDHGLFITAIADIGYEELLGQSYLLFALSKGFSDKPQKGLLVVLDFDSNVIALREDFDTHGNPALPTALKRKNIPFVFAQDFSTTRAAMLQAYSSGDPQGHWVPPTTIPPETTLPPEPVIDFTEDVFPLPYQRLPVDINFNGKTDTRSAQDAGTRCFNWWHNLVIDDDAKTHADDCGDSSLFSPNISFNF